MDIQTLADILKSNGVVGAGGAGFPTYAKIDSRADTIIMNCAECEPLLKLHRQLLEKHSYEIMKAFALIGETVGAKEMIIGIKKAYKKTIDALNAHVDQFPGMRIGLLDEVYPAGDEVILIYETTGRVVRPGGLPIEMGVAVFNVETVYNLHRAMNQSTPVVDKLVSVVAEVNNPITVRVPIGTPLGELIKMAGGAKIPDYVLFVGGPMMGNIGKETDPVTKTTNAILVLPERHVIVQKKLRKTKIDLQRAASSCCQCSICTDLCPRHQLGHPIEPHRLMRAATCKDVQDVNAFVNTMFCSSCGLCEMYSCFQSLAPRSLIADVKGLLRKNGMKPPKVEAAPVAPSRELRKVPMHRLMGRLDLGKYDVDAPLDDEIRSVKSVTVRLSQHIGAPAVASVKVGDKVKRGQVIGAPAQGLSVAIHSSIDGTVKEVNDKFVIIEA